MLTGASKLRIKQCNYSEYKEWYKVVKTQLSYNNTPAYHVPLASKNSAPPAALGLLFIIR